MVPSYCGVIRRPRDPRQGVPHPTRMRWSKSSDVRALFGLASGYVVTGLLPRRVDAWLLPRLLGSSRLIGDALVRDVAGRMRFVLGPAMDEPAATAGARAWAETVLENRWLRWRALHRRPPPVDTSVDGLHHVEDALRAGRGVILWGMEFCDTLVVKIALHRAGMRVVHLSTANHGMLSPPTRLGLRLASPLHCAAENRFLDERVIIPIDGSLGYMRVLVERLEANRCVYISGERLAARQNVSAPVLGRETSFAPGAPGLAHKLGARLLPVHVAREAPLRYRAFIDAPIVPEPGLGKSAFVDQAVRTFAERLGRRITEHPSGWTWLGQSVEAWRRGVTSSAGEGEEPGGRQDAAAPQP